MRGILTILLLAPGGPGRFFREPEVDYWGTRRPPAAAPAPAEEDLWADSNAPAPVLRLLREPSRGNAEAYLAWQAARLQGLRRAIAAIEEARRPETPAPAEILYFARPGCRYCALQDRELGDLPVVRVPAGSPLWEAYGVTVTPTLVVRGRVLRGLTPRAALLRELSRG